MEFVNIVDRLENNSAVFENLLSEKAEKEYLWRPHLNKWCLLEILCHLLDEEQEDFKARVKHALEYPTAPLKSINPEGWVKTRNYLSQDYDQTLNTFLKERKSSISWLRLQADAKWDNVINHPELGELSAELFLANWLAHDYLHIRQILRYQYNFLKEKLNMDLSYAGNW